jgi:uncharacterized protein YdcH (DUF465 family)
LTRLELARATYIAKARGVEDGANCTPPRRACHEAPPASPVPRACRGHRELSQSDSAFDELLHRYGHTVERLRELTSAPRDAAAEEVETLKKRRTALEEELLLMVNVNRP